MTDSTALATRPELGVQQPDQIQFTESQVELIKDTIAKDQHLSDGELRMFLYAAGRQGLDPLAKQIYAIKRQGKMTLQTSIDGYRSIASRTGQYAGNENPVFEWDTPEGGVKQLLSATVTVHRMVGPHRCQFVATAYWDEYYPATRDAKAWTGMWDAMPRTMLAKCAEALALRKAFPAELSGTYVDAEMDQAGRGDTAPAMGHGPHEPAAITIKTVIDFGKHKGKTIEAAGLPYWKFLVEKIKPEDEGKSFAKFARAALAAFSLPVEQRTLQETPAGIESMEAEEREFEARMAREST